jgi:hypothetical protein
MGINRGFLKPPPSLGWEKESEIFGIAALCAAIPKMSPLPSPFTRINLHKIDLIIPHMWAL